YCQKEEGDRPYTSRYIGSLVSDFHRNMIKGGIYMYPQSSKNPNGKLRLLYECNPMAFLAEQANGKASDGLNRILDIEHTAWHERAPVIWGSKNNVEKAERFVRETSYPSLSTMLQIPQYLMDPYWRFQTVGSYSPFPVLRFHRFDNQ